VPERDHFGVEFLVLGFEILGEFHQRLVARQRLLELSHQDINGCLRFLQLLLLLLLLMELLLLHLLLEHCRPVLVIILVQLFSRGSLLSHLWENRARGDDREVGF